MVNQRNKLWGKTKVLEEKTDTLRLLPTQIPHQVPQHSNQALAVRKGQGTT